VNQLYLSCDNRVTMSTLGHGLGCSAHTHNQAHCNVMMQTTFTSSTGVKIPAIRLGTFQSKGQESVFFIPAVRPTKSTYLSGLYRSPRGHTLRSETERYLHYYQGMHQLWTSEYQPVVSTTVALEHMVPSDPSQARLSNTLAR
jgi:hypothetical protein